MSGTCRIDSCERPRKQRGLCGAHYARWLKHGDVQEDVPIGSNIGRRYGPSPLPRPPCDVCGEKVKRPINRFCSQQCRLSYGETQMRSRNPSLRAESARSHQARKRQIVQDLKVERGCADCGYNAHAVALDFDHRPGEIKLFSIGTRIATHSMKRIMAEIAKCDVVCANCHRVRTHERRQHIPRRAQ